MLKQVPDESRRKTCEVHLRFYLTVDPLKHAVPCTIYDNRTFFLYRFSKYRVLFQIDGDSLTVWSFLSL
jgi:mRNA-degrading endonuclease RelE of RelBE toxin-antitoxin system